MTPSPVRAAALFAAGLLATLNVFAAETQTRPMNVLWIIADDLRPELGCYGVEGILTPNIDALAARSVQFDRAYVQYPLCNPSRSSLLTGRYPTQTGVMDNRQWWGYRHSQWTSLPKWFRDNGYATLRTGKIFHEGIDDQAAWVEGGETRRYPDDSSEHIDGPDSKGKGADVGGQKGNLASGSDRFVVLEGNGEKYGDYQHAAKAIEYLKKYGHQSQPFFLALGFTNPHSPPRAPQKFYDLYDADKIVLPPDFAQHPTVPTGFPELSVAPRNTDLFIGRDASEKDAKEMKRAYWAATSFMDDNAGRVLKALDELGLRENTIVVFWGDHGYHLGEKGRWSKAYSLFEVATRAPLLISVPGAAGNGKKSARPVEVINLYRTLSDLCGLPSPKDVEGVSMAPLLQNPSAPWDRPAYSVVQYRGHLGKAVETDRWHYARWDDGEGGQMLIDRQNDPRELHNLADDATHVDTLHQMQALLAKLPAQ